MQTSQIVSSVIVGGIQFSSTVTRQGEGQISHVVDIPAGVAGAISATGADGLATGHGIAQGATIDLYWTDAGAAKSRRGLLVDATAANAITFDNAPAAEGDALPAEDTAVVISVQVPIDTAWDYAGMEMIAAVGSTGCGATFLSGSVETLVVPLTANEAWSWASGQGITNPITADITGMVVSNATTTAGTFKLGLLYQSA